MNLRRFCYNTLMRYVKVFGPLACIGLSVLLTACSYHGRVRRGLYEGVAQPQKAAVSLLVISDKYIPEQISITDPNNSSLYGFTLDVSDATAVAVTDALGAFVTQADAGNHTLEPNYDLAADVKLASELTRSNCTSELKNLAARQNGLCTQLTLTIRRAGQDSALGTFSARRWNKFDKPGAATVIRWINQHTLYLLSPVLLPAYTQLQGVQLRHQFETHLQEILDDISEQLRKHPDVFTPPSAPTR